MGSGGIDFARVTAHFRHMAFDRDQMKKKWRHSQPKACTSVRPLGNAKAGLANSTRQRATSIAARSQRHDLSGTGHVIIATFAIDGPTKCSGLDVVRYDAVAIGGEFGAEFELREQVNEIHLTPWNTEQKFSYGSFITRPTVHLRRVRRLNRTGHFAGHFTTRSLRRIACPCYGFQSGISRYPRRCMDDRTRRPRRR